MSTELVNLDYHYFSFSAAFLLFSMIYFASFLVLQINLLLSSELDNGLHITLQKFKVDDQPVEMPKHASLKWLKPVFAR